MENLTATEIAYNEIVKIFELFDIAWVKTANEILAYIIVLVIFLAIVFLPLYLFFNFFKYGEPESYFKDPLTRRKKRKNRNDW